MVSKKTVDLDEFLRLARQGVSPARLSVRFGLATATVKKLALDHGVRLPGIKDIRRRNGLAPRGKWEPQ